MKVLMLSYEYPPIGGGGSRVVYGLARELEGLGHEIDLVTMGFRALPSVQEVNGITIHRVRCVRRREDLCHPHEMLTYVVSALPLLRRLVRNGRYDINHTHFLLPDGLLAYTLNRATGLPYVITVHGSDVPGYNPDRFKVYHKLLSPVWNMVARSARDLICPSESLQALVRKRNPRLPTLVVPNGVRTTPFNPQRPKQDRILVVTRMLPRKGVQYVLQALEGTSLGYEIDIVGDGQYLPAIRAQARQRRVPAVFHGWLDNDSLQLRELYETARIFVFTSEAENFPTVLLEAMASGCAIITTRGTGCAEVVGDAAVLVDPRAPEQIRDALALLAADRQRCERLGRAGRARVAARFTWSAVARRYQDVYARHGRAGSRPSLSLAAGSERAV